MERYYSYSRFIKEYFGEKLYKICIDGGFTCPNRDGTLATGGCIFCSEGGSGEFTENASLSVSEQIHLGKSQTSRKYQGEHYIAYFQAFTNTYAPVDRLRALYEEAITAPEIVALSIGTRPDCITPEILDLLEVYTAEEDKDWLHSCRLIVVSDRIAQTAENLGWSAEQIIVSLRADNQSLFEIISQQVQ